VCWKLQFCKNQCFCSAVGFILRNTNAPSQFSWQVFLAVLGILDILVRIRIRGYVPLTNGSQDLDPDPTPDSTPFRRHIIFNLKNLIFFSIIFCVKILFCKHYFSPLNTFMRKGRIRTVRLTNGFGRPKTSGSGSPTLVSRTSSLNAHRYGTFTGRCSFFSKLQSIPYPNQYGMVVPCCVSGSGRIRNFLP
jgi:hypothetical protein